MSIHILVPQERLAELLKHEHELKLLCDIPIPDWKGFDKNSPQPENIRLRRDLFDEKIDNLLKTKDGLANYLGYQYTVSTDAAYFENLEDMLGDEE